MLFTRRNCDLVKAGVKTCTCRRNNRYKVRETYAACPGRGTPAEARILVVNIVPFERARDAVLTPQDAHAEGYEGILSWGADYQRLNGVDSLEERTFKIRFVLADSPAAGQWRDFWAHLDSELDLFFANGACLEDIGVICRKPFYRVVP